MTNPIADNAPKEVILFTNGMVAVFNAVGEQMPDFQGERSQVIQQLRNADLSECKFSAGVWGKSLEPISQSQFFDETWLPTATG
ncbi:hypothetical protein H6G00_00965 [Leptolyngbya sp. FACHB-541]|uniref:hypothetical protein n=1 Tax=Leptolyngbya sp. FACHB-541 TaxID=2692810 RepID=UPI00168245BD|nr:hypothetical protein [Leptolyngbya sp. FACHB-541]MBD1995199.1 hypothetical protein [Leptolyngbya sp. FACHB-541]